MSKALKLPRKNHLDLARKILELAQQRALTVGSHLPEQLYASLCNVSRTPVRSAFKILEKQGILTWSKEVGFTLASDLSSAEPTYSKLPSAAEAALAQSILQDKSARRLGDAVTVSEIMRRYKVSRKVVLKSITELCDDGVLVRAPGQSWVFKQSPDNSEALPESLEYRLLLEPAAILASGFSLDGNRATALRQAMERLLAMPDSTFDPMEYQRLDLGFHSLIAQCCGNRFLSDALADHLKLARVNNAASAVGVYRMRQATLEHLKILDSLESQQYDIGADLLRIHLKLSRAQRPDAAGRGAPTLFGFNDRTLR
jgi:DNA-binding GntR family transcriptional regulator